MLALIKVGFAGSAYVFGAATGLAVALPLASVAFVPSASAPGPQPAAELPVRAIGPTVNRSTKGPRLDISLPVGASAPARSLDIVPEATSIVTRSPASATTRSLPADTVPASPAVDRRPPQAKQPSTGSNPTTIPRGCLSALGGLRSTITTQVPTVCVADISNIQ